jgi:hypothetical protein
MAKSLMTGAFSWRRASILWSPNRNKIPIYECLSGVDALQQKHSYMETPSGACFDLAAISISDRVFVFRVKHTLNRIIITVRQRNIPFCLQIVKERPPRVSFEASPSIREEKLPPFS